MKMKRAAGYTSAVALALAISTVYAADYATTPPSDNSATNTQSSTGMTGKQKATAIGAGTGAVAGAVVGGPIGAVVGAAAGGVVGHEGTDANGKIREHNHNGSMSQGDDTVRKAQAALNDQGFNAGSVDGRMGPNTDSAVRSFQAKNGLAESGTLDSATLNALGVSK